MPPYPGPFSSMAQASLSPAAQDSLLAMPELGADRCHFPVLQNVLVSFGLRLVWGQIYTTTVGSTGPQSLAISAVSCKEAISFSCLILPSPTEMG